MKNSRPSLDVLERMAISDSTFMMGESSAFNAHKEASGRFCSVMMLAS
jgi:hypothetical protein